MASNLIYLLTLTLAVTIHGSEGSKTDWITKVIYFISRTTNPDVIPIDEAPIVVHTSFSLSAIRELDFTRNEIEVVGWPTFMYNNPILAWQDLIPEVDNIRLPADRVWLPDIEPFNAVETPSSTLYHQAKAVVYKNGDVNFIPALRVRFSCNLQGMIEGEGSNCTLVLGSWTHSGLEINMESWGQVDKIDLSSMAPHPTYRVVDTFVEKNVQYYPCCDEPYVTMNFTMSIEYK